MSTSYRYWRSARCAAQAEFPFVKPSGRVVELLTMNALLRDEPAATIGTSMRYRIAEWIQSAR